MFGKKKGDEIADHRRPPISMTKWRVPPMGSMGDEWDDSIELPKVEEAPLDKPRAAAKKREKRKKAEEVVLKEFEAPLHPAVILTCVLIALSVSSHER